MPRSLLYVSAVIVVLCAILTTAKVTTTRQVALPACPHCGAPNVPVGAKINDATVYQCPKCYKSFTGPVRYDFSWAEAFEEWLSP